MIPNINDDDDNDSQYKCKQPFWLETFTICQTPIHPWRQIYWGGGADDDDDDDDHDHDNFGDYDDHDDDYDDAEEKDTCKFEERNGADDDLWEAGATYSETDSEWWNAKKHFMPWAPKTFKRVEHIIVSQGIEKLQKLPIMVCVLCSVDFNFRIVCLQ